MEIKGSVVADEIIDKIDKLVNDEKIKRIIFVPSNISFWEVKSNTNNNTYYVDLKRSFCSCKGFYFNFIKGKCYHIQAANIAFEQDRYKIEILKDFQINDFINNLLRNLLN